jgi:hypothetical protein
MSEWSIKLCDESIVLVVDLDLKLTVLKKMFPTPEEHKHLPTPLKSNGIDLQRLYLLLAALKLHPETPWIVVPSRTLELFRQIRVSDHLNVLAQHPRSNEQQFGRHKFGDEAEHTTKLRF